MTRSETAQLLARIVAFDRRTLGETDVLAWHEVLHDIDYEDALPAVVAHFASSNEWLMPFDVRKGAKKIRRDRLERSWDLVPAADPDDPMAYIAALRDDRRAVGAGLEHHPIPDLKKVFRSIT